MTEVRSHKLGPLSTSIPTSELQTAGVPIQRPSKQRLLDRIEQLWGEGADGLEASKEPIYLTRADGSTVELKAGDLRARKGFIGELREILRLQAEATGDLVRGQNFEANFAVQIVVPDVRPQPEHEVAQINIGLPTRR